MDIRQFMNRKIIFDSRSVENMSDHTLRSEVQPAQANDQGHRRAAEFNGALLPCPYIKGATGALVPFHNSIIRHFIVYKDLVETNLLQLFAHPEDSKWFSIIFVIIFEISIVTEQKQSQSITIFLSFVSFHCPQLFYCIPCPTAAPASLLMTAPQT